MNQIPMNEKTARDRKEVTESDVQSVKKRLIEYKEVQREIENEEELLGMIQTRLIGLGSPIISDMPKGSGQVTDRKADMIEQKMEIEGSIRDKIRHQKNERDYFESVLSKAVSSDERAVIRLRYFWGNDWGDISLSLFGGKYDFMEKESSYLRRTIRIHKRALVRVAEYIKSSGKEGCYE